MSLSAVNIIGQLTMFGRLQQHRDSTVHLAVKSNSRRDQTFLYWGRTRFTWGELGILGGELDSLRG